MGEAVACFDQHSPVFTDRLRSSGAIMEDDYDFDQYLIQNFDTVLGVIADRDVAATTKLTSYYAVLRIQRYERWGNTQDLDEAVKKSRWALDMTAEDDENFASRLNDFGVMLEYRYKRTGSMEVLEEAIQVTRLAIKVTPNDHLYLACCLNNLGNQLGRRYKRIGKTEDLEEGIQVARQAIKVTPDDHPHLASRLNNLGTKLESRYERIGIIEDLEEAIQVERRAINVTPNGYLHLAGRLNNLGNKLESRYERTGEMKDLEEAIQVARQAVMITPDDHPDFATWLNNLGNKLGSRYERTGKMEDLKEAIKVARQAVKATPDDHPDLAGLLNNLGTKLGRLYERTGAMEDLEEAIELTRKAVKVTPDGYPHLSSCLNNLGTKLESRYERTGKMKDLEEAIQVARQAVMITPDDHPDFATWLNNLGNKLGSRYERTGKMEDLEEAIQVAQQAVEVTLDEHPYLACCLNDLGNKLEGRYKHTGKIADLQEAIRVARQAVEFTPGDHPDLAGLLNNLGNRLESRYECTGKMDDLEEAIRVSRQAVDITPDDHPDFAAWLYNLGQRLMLTASQRSDALQLFECAWNCHASVPFTRVRASAQAIRLLQERERHADAFRLSVEALEVLPRVHNRSLSRQDQQYVVSTFSGLAASACSLALQTGQPPETALKVLERGRAVILSLVMDDRSDTSALKTIQPDLCATYESLLMEVNTTTIDSISDQSLRELAVKRRPKAIEELDKCIRDIQQLPSFDRFQRGLSPKQMQQCAIDGCIVVVNVTGLRSDAIIVSKQGFSTIPLPSFEASRAKSWIDQDLTIPPRDNEPSKNPDYRRFLSWLWRGCVKPILDGLGYQPSSIDSLPRIWWIGTGLASSLPFHAAGDPIRLAESSYSRVISSYTPSIKALQYARERRSSTAKGQCSPPNLLLVMMATTPEADDLPGTKDEKSKVIEAVGASASVHILDQPDVASVVQHLRGCNVAHFACHGVSDPADPSESGLLLESVGADTADPVVDVLSVRKVSEAHLLQAEIAYLSACSTAENRAGRLEDEVLHIVSGFQVAGFRHVIGCLWPSLDSVCVEVARLFYSNLVSGRNAWRDDRAVAVALQKAVVAVRESNEYRKRPLAWAQYVHFGA